jgi:tRNA(Ile2) C34 agmatinyltransferase TiaS
MIAKLDNCPVCGTKGKSWNGEQSVFECPHCSSVFSKFGIVSESKKEVYENWN